MKKFVKDILLFSLALIGINFLAYRFIAEPLLYKGYFKHKQEMKPYRSFLLGDSHAKAIRQVDLENLSIFNFAYDTDSYFDTALKLKYLIRNNLADTIYLCTDNHTLSHYRESWTNRSRSLYYADYNEYKQYYGISPRNFRIAKYIYIHLPLLNTENSKLFRKYIGNIIQGNKMRNYDNFDISTVPHENLVNSSLRRVNTQFPGNKQSEKLVQTLDEMLEICKLNNIVVYGIKYPLTREYINAMGDKSYKADSVMLSKNYKVFDFTNAFPDSTHFFRDQDHVNYKGSEEFVKYIQSKGF